MLKRFFGRERAESKPDAEQLPDAGTSPSPSSIEESLSRTRKSFGTRLAAVFGPVDIADDTWEELEARLIQADVGVRTAVEMVEDLQAKARYAGLRRASELPDLLHAVMVKVLNSVAEDDASDESTPTEQPKPFIVLMVGVNGSGKTTTIAKLTSLWVRQGQDVVLVAADTFRAAAIEQLQVWGERLGVPVIASQPGGDPGSVVFDALNAKVGTSADIVIVDTAGRLHTQHNLMAELIKVRGVIQKIFPDAPHETLLVLDANTGQNGLIQAKAFAEAVDVSGIVLAKLDSSAKGGVAFAVTRELGLPILYVGTGEALEDLAPFDPEAYADGVLGRIR